MDWTHEPEHHYPVGCYTCPVTKAETNLEAETPRAWVHWPMHVHCKACGGEHLLQYDDVRTCEPIFGRE